jgi:hypothetical protein
MPWYGWIIAGVLVLLALWAVGALVIGDRAKGRRRCPKCWHSLEGLPRVELEPQKGLRGKARTRDKSGEGGSDEKPGGWICPECGRAVRREKDLFRTRRKRGVLAVVAVGLLAGLGWYGYGVHQRRAEGKTAWVPTLAAVVLVRPLEPDGSDPAWNQSLRTLLVDRRNASAMHEWEHDLLAWRFIRIWEGRVWSQVHLRDAWIKGEPIPVYVQIPSLSGELFSQRISLELPGVTKQIEAEALAPFFWGLATNQSAYTPSPNPVRHGSSGVIPASHADEIIVELVAHLELSTNMFYLLSSGQSFSQTSPSWNTQPGTTKRTIRKSFTISLVDSARELLDSGVIRPVRDDAFDADHPARRIQFDSMGRFDRWSLYPAPLSTNTPPPVPDAEYSAMYTIELVYNGLTMFRQTNAYPVRRFPHGYDPNAKYETVFYIDTDPETEGPPLPGGPQSALASGEKKRPRLGLIDDSWTYDSATRFEEWITWHRYMKVKGLGEEPDMADWSVIVTPRPDLVLRCPELDLYWTPADGAESLEIPLTEWREPTPSAWPVEIFDSRTSPPPSP